MRKAILFSLSLLALLLTTALTSCEKNEPGDDLEITVRDNSALSQNVFADETQGSKEVSFSTKGAWTSSILETTKTNDNPAWISIYPESGNSAGNHKTSISLTPNHTGKDREATISIFCGDNSIEIKITQKSVKEDGNAPVEATGIIISHSSLTLFVGEEVTLYADPEPTDADGITILWSSSDERIATVSETGTVKATAVGEVTITASTPDGSLTASCVIEVKPLMTFEEFLSFCDELVDAALVDYVKNIDHAYSSYDARLGVTPATDAIRDYWNRSYEAIDACNVILTTVDANANMSEEAKENQIGRAHV